MLGLPFYEGAITCKNRDRLHPEMELVINPEEVNVILYDDVMTTGVTLREARQLLMAQGHNVVQVVAIRNQ
jgi:predicted amidophosphoribosyltransferase